MSLTVARLVAETRSFIWTYLDEPVAVGYRPGVLTIAWNDLPVHEALAATLVSLDVVDAKGKPIPLDAESLAATLPVPIMRQIAQAIYADSTVDPTTAGTSGDS